LPRGRVLKKQSLVRKEEAAKGGCSRPGSLGKRTQQQTKGRIVLFQTGEQITKGAEVSRASLGKKKEFEKPSGPIWYQEGRKQGYEPSRKKERWTDSFCRLFAGAQEEKMRRKEKKPPPQKKTRPLPQKTTYQKNLRDLPPPKKPPSPPGKRLKGGHPLPPLKRETNTPSCGPPPPQGPLPSK